MIKKVILCITILFTILQANDNQIYREFKNGQDTIKWWKTLYPKLLLSGEEIKIINSYTFGNFSLINSKLRSGNPVSSLDENQKKMVKTLDEALSKTIVFENLLVYRYEGLGFISRLFGGDFIKKIYQNGSFTKNAKHQLEEINGKVYKDYGFMSTTMIRNSVFHSRPIELIIKVPKYSSALYVSLKELATFQTQYELLFPRGSVLKIEKYEFSNDNKKLSIYVKMADPCRKEPCIVEKVDNINQPKD